MSLSIKQKLLFGFALALLAEGIWWKLELSREQRRERSRQAEVAYTAMSQHQPPLPPPPRLAMPVLRSANVNPSVEQAVKAFHVGFNKGRHERTSRYAGNHTAYDELTNKLDVSRKALGEVVSSKLIVSYETTYSSGRIFEEQFSWNVTEGKIRLDDHLLFGTSSR